MGQRAAAPAIAGGATTLAACRQEILIGLTATQKRLSPKYLYDERGSQLFDEICSLPEYYPTRTELGLLRAHAAELEELVGPRAEIVELGAGSSTKARLLLAALDQPSGYLPVDISADYLAQQAAEVAAAYPRVTVQPVLADFTRPFALPAGSRANGRYCSSRAQRSAICRARMPRRCWPRSRSASEGASCSASTFAARRPCCTLPTTMRVA